jgi:hypothetical protein
VGVLPSSSVAAAVQVQKSPASESSHTHSPHLPLAQYPVNPDVPENHFAIVQGPVHALNHIKIQSNSDQTKWRTSIHIHNYSSTTHTLFFFFFFFLSIVRILGRRSRNRSLSHRRTRFLLLLGLMQFGLITIIPLKRWATYDLGRRNDRFRTYEENIKSITIAPKAKGYCPDLLYHHPCPYHHLYQDR